MRNTFLLTLFSFIGLCNAQKADAQAIAGGEEHVYHIVWHNDPSSYLLETRSGALQVGAKSRTSMQYWQFIPTDKENCYYIRNAVTGHYIEACKTTADNTYNITATAKKVEYYVASEPSLDGAYRLTSTNCANYDNTAKTPVGLNKSGSSSDIITWNAGVTNKGSYWDIVATELDFDREGLEALSQHSDFAKSAQIYFMPCGSNYSTYALKKVHLGGDVVKDLNYPCDTWSGTKNTMSAVTNTWWTLYTNDKAIVTPGSAINVTANISKALPEGYLVQACFDWDRDGVFEDVHTLDNPLAKEFAFETTVPADAKPGKSRMRLRVTDNGMTGPDDEVTAGQILDCILETVTDVSLEPSLTAVPNDPSRGSVTVTYADDDPSAVTLTATPKGNAKFKCWLEGRKVLGTLGTYKLTLTRPTTIVALFAPNTQEEEPEGINVVSISPDDTPYPAPRYFDLQGRRVDAPLSGQTYVRKTSDANGEIIVF